jgi:hypothetical protein
MNRRFRNAAALAVLLVPSVLAPSASAAPASSAALPSRYGTAPRTLHADAQARFSRSEAWRGFLARHGAAWEALWDESTGTPARFWGEGWPVDATRLASDSGARRLARDILARERALLGDSVDPGSLRPGAVDRRGGIVTVVFHQEHRGLPVDGARISLRFKENRFVMGQFESAARIDAGTRPELSDDSAVAAARRALGWDARTSRVAAEPRLVVLLLRGPASAGTRLAWRLELRHEAGDGPAAVAGPSQRILWVDALDGGLLQQQERILAAGGSVVAEHDDRNPQSGLAQSPMAYAELSAGDAGSAASDAVGAFALAGELPLSLSWGAGSQWFHIDNSGSGGDVEWTQALETEGGSLLATVDGSASAAAQVRQRAQTDAHVAAHVVRDRALLIDPSFSWAFSEATVHVNRGDAQCNAWFDVDSSLNFVDEGGGCHNTARIADVIYHEYGHGFHGWSIIPGAGAFEAALSEGLSDYMANTITGDPQLSPGFFVGSLLPLRDSAPDLSWPDDVDPDPHITGQIIAGALWDLRVALIAEYGEAAGVAHSDFLFWNVTMRAADIPTSFAEALLADDDDGNLANGTPNECILVEAFAPHGLGPASPDLAYWLEHSPMAPGLPAAETLSVSTFAGATASACTGNAISGVRLRWSVDGDPESPAGDWGAVDMTAAPGDAWVAELPGAESGTLLRYRFELVGDDGELVATWPRGSITDPWYATWIGGTDIVASWDFEADDGGFTHELLGGPQQEGADDWQWGAPSGLGGDPAAAHSGANQWGNDLAPAENWNGLYQPDIENVLRSPIVEVPENERVFLQFYRWLTVEDGYWEDAFLRVNGEVLWEQWSSTDPNAADAQHLDQHWAFRSYEVTDLVGDSGDVQVEWYLKSDQALEFGGWNVDDVRIVTIVESPPGDDDDATAPPDDDDSTESQPDDDAPADGELGGLSGNGCNCGATHAGRSAGKRASPSPAFALTLALAAAAAVRRRGRACGRP